LFEREVSVHKTREAKLLQNHFHHFLSLAAVFQSEDGDAALSAVLSFLIEGMGERPLSSIPSGKTCEVCAVDRERNSGDIGREDDFIDPPSWSSDRTTSESVNCEGGKRRRRRCQPVAGGTLCCES
jgi:hypothetical protein